MTGQLETGRIVFSFFGQPELHHNRVVSRYTLHGTGFPQNKHPTILYWSKQLWNQPRFKGTEKCIPLPDEWIAMWHCRRPSGMEDSVVTIFGKYKKPLCGRVRGRSDISLSILPKRKKKKHSLTLESIQCSSTELENNSPQTKSILLSISINKILLELNNAHLLMAYECFHAKPADLSSCNKDCMIQKPQNIYRLVFYRKSLLISVLESKSKLIDLIKSTKIWRKSLKLNANSNK